MNTTPNFRPRFKFVLELDSFQIAEKLSQYVQQNESVSPTKSYNHFIRAHRRAFRHYWSPFLDINIEQEVEKGPSLVRCLNGPAANIWTMFMFIYGLFGFVGLSLGMSQWTHQKELWGFLLLPVSLAGMLIMYLVLAQGKKMAKDDMMDLKLYVDKMFQCDCFVMLDEYKK